MMGTRDALSTLLEYNAIMELPYAGIVGIEGFLNPQSTEPAFVLEELRAFLEFCRVAVDALATAPTMPAHNLAMYAALRRLFGEEGEKKRHYRTLLGEACTLVERAVQLVNSGQRASGDDTARMRELSKDLQQLSEFIAREIPRDAYLASLTGRPLVSSERIAAR